MHNQTACTVSVSNQSSSVIPQAIPFGTLGNHVIADLSGCSSDLLSCVQYIEDVLKEGVRRARANIISYRFHKFSPTGVSGIILLSESHCSIHTWPEEGYAAIDIYTCGEHVHPELACSYIADKLHAKHSKISSLRRGLPGREGFTHNFA